MKKYTLLLASILFVGFNCTSIQAGELHEAVKKGDLNKVKRFVENSCNIKGINYSYIFDAIEYEIKKWTIRETDFCDIAGVYGSWEEEIEAVFKMRPIDYALKLEDSDIRYETVEYLVKNGARIDFSIATDYLSSIENALETKDLRLIKCMLDNGQYKRKDLIKKVWEKYHSLKKEEQKKKKKNDKNIGMFHK
jgi:hypothetical protein